MLLLFFKRFYLKNIFDESKIDFVNFIQEDLLKRIKPIIESAVEEVVKENNYLITKLDSKVSMLQTQVEELTKQNKPVTSQHEDNTLQKYEELE